jgi:hypothetical protein
LLRGPTWSTAEQEGNVKFNYKRPPTCSGGEPAHNLAIMGEVYKLVTTQLSGMKSPLVREANRGTRRRKGGWEEDDDRTVGSLRRKDFRASEGGSGGLLSAAKGCVGERERNGGE